MEHEEGLDGEASDVDSHNLSEIAEADDRGPRGARRGGSDDDEGEDLLANMSEDYRAMEGLDEYEAEGLDDEAEVEGGLTYEEVQANRLRAEREMARRDAREDANRAKRLPGALEDDMDDDGEDDRRSRRRHRANRAQGGHMGEDTSMPDVGVDLENLKGDIREAIAGAEVRDAIKAKFMQFLREAENHRYMERLDLIATGQKKALEVEYEHFAGQLDQPGAWVINYPRQLLAIFDEAARAVGAAHMPLAFGDGGGGGDDPEAAARREFFVRIVGLPIETPLREIRHKDLNQLIRVAGVVTRRTGVFPQLSVVKYLCKCGYTLGPFHQNTQQELKPLVCTACQAKSGFEVDSQQTVYRNFQRLTLQESPGTVEAGRVPRHKEVILLNDLIDCARPGEEIEVTGIYCNTYDAGLNIKNGFPVFSTVIEANSVTNALNRFEAFKLTEEDRSSIRRLARRKDIGELITRSIAPSIYGHDNIKLGICLALFGGQEKAPSGSHRLRGDINMLLLGDPGTAKSQFLKVVQGCAQRAVYTTGKGASAVGLTAAVQKDAVTREWTLEGGALVLADRGVCLIDEFDKMNDQDRVSIHEAMEQQSISISKAGIVTSLQARCSVIAAANPIWGRYDRSRTFAENVELSDPILSRFDILCVIEDIVDPVNDERLADFVVSSHTKAAARARGEEEEAPASAPAAFDEGAEILPQEELKKYITYAKQMVKPKLADINRNKITEVYTELRQESQMNHGMPIAVRHLESIIRMSEAHARMHLRTFVTDEDVDKAISVMLNSFISTQKVSVQKVLTKRFRRYLTASRDVVPLLMTELQALIRQKQRDRIAIDPSATGPLRVFLRVLRNRVAEYKIDDLNPLFQSPQFSRAGFQYHQADEVISLDP